MAQPSESSQLAAVVMVLAAGCVTGSSLTAVFRDRAAARRQPARPLTATVFQIEPEAADGPGDKAPGVRRQTAGDKTAGDKAAGDKAAGDKASTQRPSRRQLAGPAPEPRQLAAAPAPERLPPAMPAPAVVPAPAAPVPEARPVVEPLARQPLPPMLEPASAAAPSPAPGRPLGLPELNSLPELNRPLSHSPAFRPAPPAAASSPGGDAETMAELPAPRFPGTIANPYFAAAGAVSPSPRGSGPLLAPDTPALAVNASPTPDAEQADRAGPLTAAEQARVRQAIAQAEPRVAELVAAGMAAGSRKASYVAHEKLLDALRLLAQTADIAASRNVRSSRLSGGLLALEESADFAQDANRFGGVLPTERVVSQHRSEVVSPAEAEGKTHVELQRRYLESAQAELAAAAADSPAGAQALLGLAKFHLQQAENGGMEREGPRAFALCQAALIVDPSNHGAANELGALLAKSGQLEDARQVLLRSLRLQSTRAAWHNLAVVHQRLGETRLAELARLEQSRLAATTQLARRRQVQWMDKQAFAGTHAGPFADSVLKRQPVAEAESSAASAPLRTR